MHLHQPDGLHGATIELELLAVNWLSVFRVLLPGSVWCQGLI